MFGGLALMIGGRMWYGMVGSDLMLRLGPDGTDAALERPHVRAMDFTGRPLTSMVYAEPDGLRDGAWRRWVEMATTFARSLPPKC